MHSTPHIAAFSFTHGQSPWNSALRVIRKAEWEIYWMENSILRAKWVIVGEYYA